MDNHIETTADRKLPVLVDPTRVGYTSTGEHLVATSLSRYATSTRNSDGKTSQESIELMRGVPYN